MNATTKNYCRSDAEIRAAMKERFGSRNARVTKNGEIHVRDVMPNTSRPGWYLFGFTGDPTVDEQIWNPDGSIRI